MAAPTTSSALRHAPVRDWGRVPLGTTFHGDAPGVAVDSQDRLYVFNRGPVPVVVFDPDGTYLRGLEGEFGRAHSANIDHEDNLWLVDDEAHVVEKRTLEGRLLLRLGTPGQPTGVYSGEPFNMPTDVAVNPRTGEIYVTDGYCNTRVHRFAPDGTHIASFGSGGDGPGEFALPHGVAILDDDRVVVCDRLNHRIQVFGADGEFVQQWPVFHPAGVRYAHGLLYVTQLGMSGTLPPIPNLGDGVSVFDLDGDRLTRLGAPLPGGAPDQFLAPHGIAVDSRGDVYVGEVSFSWNVHGGKFAQPPGELVCLRKWRRVEK